MAQSGEYKLSQNKQLFMHQYAPTSKVEKGKPIQLTATELPKLADHYFKKHKIVILINGETDLGKNLIEQGKAAIRADIDSFGNETTKYAKYVQRCWQAPNIYNPKIKGCISNTYPSSFWQVYAEIYQRIEAFLVKGKQLKSDLTAEELLSLNKIHLNLSLECSEVFHQGFKAHIDGLEENYCNQCLIQGDCELEIQHIQQSLVNAGSPAAVGYVLTGNRAQGMGHFEAIVITKDKIIKPAVWQDYSFIRSELVCEPQLSNMMPQSGPIECGTLSFLYLKELLKEEALQLNDYTFSFQLYDHRRIRSQIFFPSPQILRYSQATLYNKILLAQLKGEEDKTEIIHQNEKHTYFTLKGLLKRSMLMARVYGNQPMIDHHTKFLEDLPAFRARWLAAYEKANEKRELMQSDVNLYLACCTHRMRAISSREEDVLVQKRLARVYPRMQIAITFKHSPRWENESPINTPYLEDEDEDVKMAASAAARKHF